MESPSRSNPPQRCSHSRSALPFGRVLRLCSHCPKALQSTAIARNTEDFPQPFGPLKRILVAIVPLQSSLKWKTYEPSGPASLVWRASIFMFPFYTMDGISVKLSNTVKSQEINYFLERQREQILYESGEMAATSLLRMLLYLDTELLPEGYGCFEIRCDILLCHV